MLYRRNWFIRHVLLDFVKELKVAYHPGRPNSELHYYLVQQALRPPLTDDKNLKFSYQLLNDNVPGRIQLTYKNGKTIEYVGETFNFGELWMEADRFQNAVVSQFMTEEPIHITHRQYQQ